MNKSHSSKSFIELPGPGSYNLSSDLNNEGKFGCSSFKNITQGKFHKSKRFLKLKQNDLPGPGAYKHITTFSGCGFNFLSTMKSANAITIHEKTKSNRGSTNSKK